MPLHRSREHRMIAGVCGGIAEWLDLDPQHVRLAYVVLSVFTAFAGLPVYLLLWLFVPPERQERSWPLNGERRSGDPRREEPAAPPTS